MSRRLALFIIISCNCVTYSTSEIPCSSFHGATSDVRGVIGDNTSLTCNVPTNCIKGYWKYENTTNVEWLLPGEYGGNTYFFSSIPSQGLNSLHIVNINDSVEGFYTCLCDDHNGRRTAHACFNLSVHVVQCHMIVQIHGEKREFDRCSMRSVVERVDVEVEENITINCENAIRSTNCSHIGKRFSFTVNPSHHLCRFSCRTKKQSVKRQIISIILNVTDNVISTTAMILYTKTRTLANDGNLTPCDESPSVLSTSLQTHLTVYVPGYISPTSRWTTNDLILRMIMPFSIIFVFGIVVLSTCAYVLFYKTGVCTSSLQYNTQTAGNVYHDIVEMQSPNINSCYTTCIDHQTDLGENEIALLSANGSNGKNLYSSHFYGNQSGAHCTVNTISPGVSMDGAVRPTVYNKVLKPPAEITCTMSYSKNLESDTEIYTEVADMERHNKDDTEIGPYPEVVGNSRRGRGEVHSRW